MSSYRKLGAASTYASEGILSESPLELIVRIYDLASQHVSRARSALAAGKINAKGAAVGRAIRCISLLQTSLNRAEGGEVARNLDRIYTYLLGRLSRAHLANDDDAFAEVARHLAELGSAWGQAARSEHAGAVPPAHDTRGAEMAAP